MINFNEEMKNRCFEIKDLCLSYNDIEVFKNLNVGINELEVTSLIGPSGCGKTSFLSCLNRMTDFVPQCRVKGSIRFFNTHILDPKMNVFLLRKRVGMIFQKPNPFPLSIYKNLDLPLKYHGMRKSSERNETLTKSLVDVGLWNEVKDRLHSSALKLSGGQQQRLCIARAIALNPEVLLMDEPCSALDPISTEVIEKLIRNLSKKITLVVVTHNLAQAKRISDRTILFWNKNGCGQLLESGQTKDVFSSPKTVVARSYFEGVLG